MAGRLASAMYMGAAWRAWEAGEGTVISGRGGGRSVRESSVSQAMVCTDCGGWAVSDVPHGLTIRCRGPPPDETKVQCPVS